MTLKNKLTNFLLIAISIGLPLFITDIILKKLKFPSSNSGNLLIGGGYLQTNPKTKVKSYSEGKKIRHSAVYGKEVIYDYEFITDQNGFRITHHCNKNNNDSDLIAIAGDSFTEGQGVPNISWASTLQKVICERNHQSVNLSFPGIGVIDMKNSLKFAKDELKATKAVVSIITSDIYRPYLLLENNKKCSMFLKPSDIFSECGQNPATWWHIPKTWKKSELINFVTKKYKYGLIPTSKIVLKDFIKQSKRIIKTYLPSSILKKIGTNNFKELILDSSNALNQIAYDFNVENMILIILPDKTDRNLVIKNSESKRQNDDLKMFLKQINPKITILDVRSCPLNKTHFYKLDGHPNFEGQKLLGECVINNQKIKEFIQ
ncbi:hypothetical protein N9V02_05695 [Prochlorococcus sp. AH-736-L23]|nr:hypothetical protein [Prochlorococcus sp. AH-736-L23]